MSCITQSITPQSITQPSITPQSITQPSITQSIIPNATSSVKKLTERDIRNKIAIICNFLPQHAECAVIIFENLQKQNIDKLQIIQIIEEVLPLCDGNIKLLNYVNSFDCNILNMFKNLDKILHKLDTQSIRYLCDNKIININLSATLNNVSIEKVMYIIIQFSEYNIEIKKYLFDEYAIKYVNKKRKTYITNYIAKANLLNISISEENKILQALYYKILRDLEAQLLIHMLYYNVCNDIFVYIKACIDNNMLSADILNFNRILESFQAMDAKYKNDKNNICLRSRLVGVIKLISDQCLYKVITIPEYTDYKKNFNTFYNIHNIKLLQDVDVHIQTTNKKTRKHTKITNKQQLINILDLICYDSYYYIDSQLPWGSQENKIYV